MDGTRPIDAAVAITLAYWRASRSAASVYESEGLIVL
jgi:hypothetical protein